MNMIPENIGHVKPEEEAISLEELGLINKMHQVEFIEGAVVDEPNQENYEFEEFEEIDEYDEGIDQDEK